VRHILILLSFFLLSSPVIGDNHKGESLYGWGEWGDYKWMGFGDVETHPVYEGQVENGKPNGEGILTFPVIGDKYVGEWKNGEKNGLGTRTFPVGWEVGEYKDGVLWNGTYYDENGNIYGKYVNGKWIKP